MSLYGLKIMDKRYKYFQIATIYLVKQGIKFRFDPYYISCNKFDMSLDQSDKSKVWLDISGDWKPFVDIDSFKKFITTL